MPFGAGYRMYLAGESARQHGHMYALGARFTVRISNCPTNMPHIPEPIAFCRSATCVRVHIDGLADQHADIAAYKRASVVKHRRHTNAAESAAHPVIRWS